jgi:hypothetical protein
MMNKKERRNLILILAVIIIIIVFIALLIIILPQTIVKPKNPKIFSTGGADYEFNNNINDSWSFVAQSPENITALLRNANKVIIIYNGSVREDNGVLAVTAFNIVSKLQTYYTQTQGKIAVFGSIDLYNMPNYTGVSDDYTYIYLVGPNSTDNKQNSLALMGSLNINGATTEKPWILVQGNDYTNLTRAAEKLELLVIGYGE